VPEVNAEVLRPPAASVSRPPEDWRSSGAKLLSLAVSAALLIGLYRSVNFRLILEELRGIDRVWLVISLGTIVPITILRAIRFFWVAPAGALPGIVEALRLTLVATALNVFLPAKTGDLIKSYFVAKRGGTSAGVSVAIIVYERLCDLFGLTSWCVLGWFVGRPVVARVPSALWPLLGALGAVCAVLISSERIARLWPAMMARALPDRLRRLQALAQGWPDLFQVLRGRRGWVALFSLLLWLVHLVQIWMFALALSVPIPFTVCASLSAVALLAGQLPLTFAGLGARDVALVVLLSGYVRPESAAAMGILISTRNLLPPLAALPIMRSYLSAVVDEVRVANRERANPA
jgi:hypothetical protein